MMTPAEVRKLALSLPEATEQDHWGNPSFRVKGKKALFEQLMISAWRRVAPKKVAALLPLTS